MFMDRLLPQFRNWVQEHIIPRKYDFLVPLESKGHLVIQYALHDSPIQIRSLRAFDFLSPEELIDKRIAVLDDAIFTGRTINRAVQALRERGASHVEMYAFLLHDSDPHRSDRKIGGVTFCDAVSDTDFCVLAYELSELSRHARPSFPDHLVVRLQLDRALSPADMRAFLADAGLATEHRYGDDSYAWSVHFPRWSPALNNDVSCSGLDKARINLSRDGATLDFAPIVFPVASEDAVAHSDALEKSVAVALQRPWHNDEVRSRNNYDAITIAARFRLVAAFLEDFRAVADYSNPQLQPNHLPAYFGPDVAGALDATFQQFFATRKGVALSSSAPSVGPLHESPLYAHTVQSDIVLHLRDAYLKSNLLNKSRFDYQSVGATISELSQRIGHSVTEVALAVEDLNDRGYLSPLPYDRRVAAKPSRVRSYRVTETGSAWILDD
jgi:hypothetical protein